ncbi:MAG: hypothetical protein AABW51_00535 [Nanoarchaeota archaeon]
MKNKVENKIKRIVSRRDIATLTEGGIVSVKLKHFYPSVSIYTTTEEGLFMVAGNYMTTTKLIAPLRNSLFNPEGRIMELVGFTRNMEFENGALILYDKAIGKKCLLPESGTPYNYYKDRLSVEGLIN